MGHESILYPVGAEAGQTLRVSLEPCNLATYFSIYAPGHGPGHEAIANSGMTGPGVPDLNRFKAKLASSGEYTISVYMMRPAARREERSDYTLDIALEGETGAVVEGDFADGLQGGPNFWEVRTTGVQLNPRSDLSAGAARLRGLGTRAVLRNLGCRMAE